MKRIFNIILNLLPFVVWGVWFYLALNELYIYPDWGLVQILLLVCLPIMYSVYNAIVWDRNKTFIIQNGIFAVSQVSGCYICGVLYYNFISSDSETQLVTSGFSFISVIYIAVLTLVCCGIKILINKIKE